VVFAHHGSEKRQTFGTAGRLRQSMRAEMMWPSVCQTIAKRAGSGSNPFPNAVPEPQPRPRGMKLAAGRAREAHWLVYAIAVLFAWRYLLLN
jgi:hypothetical protein